MIRPTLVTLVLAAAATGCGKEPKAPTAAKPARDAAAAPAPDAAPQRAADAAPTPAPPPAQVDGPFVGVWQIDFDALEKEPTIAKMPAAERARLVQAMRRADTRVTFGGDGTWTMKLGGAIRRGGYTVETVRPGVFRLLTASAEGDAGQWKVEVNGDALRMQRDGADPLPMKRAGDEKPTFDGLRPGLARFLFGKGTDVPRAPADVKPADEATAKRIIGALAGVWTRDMDAMMTDPELAKLPPTTRRARIDKARLLFAALRIELYPDGRVLLSFGRMKQAGTWTPVALEGDTATIATKMELGGVTDTELLTVRLARNKAQIALGPEKAVTLARKMKLDHGHEAPGGGEDAHDH